MTLFVSSAVSQESIASRLSQVESNNNMILSTLTAHKAQLDNIQADVSAIRAELSAVRKAAGVTVAPVSNWAGDPQFTATMAGRTSTVMMPMSSMYSSSMSMGAGACASGSCGAGSGRVGLFGRRKAGGW
jgi:hypothetical protein